LEIGSLSTLGLGMSDFLRAESIAKNSGRKLKEKSVIFVWLPGGMSQLESYDMKPNAPVEYRGVLNPIPLPSRLPDALSKERLRRPAPRADEHHQRRIWQRTSLHL